METNNKNDLKVEEMIGELVNNNKIILMHRITEDHIKSFIRSLKDNDKHTKYLKVLSNLIVCKSRAIVRT